ncbi:GtrA family protein [Dysgonomonas macrotermitis]|uniref:Putative flippase GtrA (Transmembrane translocase of bactoprenol-linked glucose) n=1 Tax=Dysgonomonas macrotermitis TaxID=1346286 RepID=A0A1M5C8X8_9BACT|nr:GtrA family protein [Dysgonomonas macrotermitis]SHF51203.1 Putative flippase GtrA (transmembrane translocase of bactoprenol-linked glucose) [Dysgonomonas macrotermitis]
MYTISNTFKQFIKYAIVGIVGAIIDWALFFILRDLLDFNYILAHIISSVAAIINNFLLNTYFTFKVKDKMLKRGMSFLFIGLIGLIIGTILLPVTVNLISFFKDQHINMLDEKTIQSISKLIVTIIIALGQFTFNKFLTFRKDNQ